jgi:hypothetical protein
MDLTAHAEKTASSTNSAAVARTAIGKVFAARARADMAPVAGDSISLADKRKVVSASASDGGRGRTFALDKGTVLACKERMELPSQVSPCSTETHLRMASKPRKRSYEGSMVLIGVAHCYKAERSVLYSADTNLYRAQT